jgi:hypothetical protein
MPKNGRRPLPRSRIEIQGAAGPGEAAAVAAAIERFVADTAPAPSTPPGSRWQAAALAESVGAKAIFGPRSPDRRDTWQL